MGVFYTVYYAAMMLGPVIGGAAAKCDRQRRGGIRLRRGSCWLACPLLLLAFNRIAQRRKPRDLRCTQSSLTPR